MDRDAQSFPYDKLTKVAVHVYEMIRKLTTQGLSAHFETSARQQLVDATAAAMNIKHISEGKLPVERQTMYSAMAKMIVAVDIIIPHLLKSQHDTHEEVLRLLNWRVLLAGDVPSSLQLQVNSRFPGNEGWLESFVQNCIRDTTEKIGRPFITLVGSIPQPVKKSATAPAEPAAAPSQNHLNKQLLQAAVAYFDHTKNDSAYRDTDLLSPQHLDGCMTMLTETAKAAAPSSVKPFYINIIEEGIRSSYSPKEAADAVLRYRQYMIQKADQVLSRL